MSRLHRQTANREWERIRREVFIRDGYRCRECGKPGRLECHHVLELAQGGGNDLGNLKALCRGCHIAAHQRKPTAAEAEWQVLVKEL